MAVEQQANAFVTRTENIYTVNRTNISESLLSSGNSLRSATIKDNLNGGKVYVSIDVTTAFSSVASTQVTIEASIDGSNWVVVDTLSADIGPGSTGPRFYTSDFTDSSSWPYFSIHFNGGAGVASKSVGTSGKLTFAYYTT